MKISIFGESHGQVVGFLIENPIAGTVIDESSIQAALLRRSSRLNSDISTPRIEEDNFKILSGVFQGKTTGASICGIIENKNIKSRDYASLKNTPRPSHADYTAYVKYQGHNDYSGGGRFSGRLTAALVFAGEICRGMLPSGTEVFAHISELGGVKDFVFDAVQADTALLKKISQKKFPVLDDKAGLAMREKILEAAKEEDSIGGIIECMIVNPPKAIGSPEESLEGMIAKQMFSVPAVKGIEFGAGFGVKDLKGSENNDEMYMEDGIVKTYSNHDGGICGGISNGMPIVFRVPIKPTPSIGKKQRTVNLETGENIEIEITGRHDPCIVPRAVPVIEAAAIIALCEALYPCLNTTGK